MGRRIFDLEYGSSAEILVKANGTQVSKATVECVREKPYVERTVRLMKQ